MHMPRIRRTLFLAAGAAVLAGGIAVRAQAETRVGGTLHEDAAWTKEGSPYVVTGDVIVPRNITLSIDPGVTVRFKPDMPSREGLSISDLEILVRGTLVVQGAAQDTVYLTSDGDEPRWTDWQGIIADGPEAKVQLSAVVLEYANEGIKCLRGSVTAKHVTVRNCNFKGIYFLEGKGDLEDVVITSVGNEGGTGIGVDVDRGASVTMKQCYVVSVQNGVIFSRNSGGTIEDTIVSNCSNRGVVIRKSNPEFNNCTITQNEYGFIISAGAAPVIHNNNIFDNNVLDVDLREYREETKMDLTKNWWGEDALGLIEERIGDGIDNTNVKAFAVIDPVLPEATTAEAKQRAEKQKKK
jgi:parallel beta-helix repeat protein